MCELKRCCILIPSRQGKAAAAAAEELTQNQREILLAYYIQDRTIPQIAEDRGCNKSTVSRTLHRAEEKLRRYLRY